MTLQSKRKTIGLRRFILTPMLLILASVSAAAQTNTFPTTGNAGAGTTSPDRKLEVLDSGSPQLRLTHTDGSVYTDFQTLSTGNLIISPTGPDTTSTKPFTVSAGSDAFRFYPTADTNLRWSFSTDASGLFNIVQKGDGWANQGTRLSINRSGNVGIGTTSPTHKLVVGSATTSSINPNFQIISAGTSQSWVGAAVNNKTMYFGSDGTTFKLDAWDYGASAPLNLNLGGNGGDLLFPSSGVWKSTGAVGIGTTTPNSAYKLDVNGEINATGIRINGTPISSGSPSQWTGTSSIYYNGGNVGIGASSPTRLFSLNATSAPYMSFNEGGAEKAVIGTEAAGYNRRFIVYDSSAAQYRLVIDNSGNVGIGTTNPIYSLDVNGGVNGFRAKAATTSSSDAIVTLENGAGIQAIVRGNGYLGLGITNPTEKLHVVGNGKLTGNLTVDGTVEGGTIKAKYQDLAEWVPSSEQLSAGTVVVLDTTKSNQVVSSTVSYDTRVAGVISAQPGITLGESGEGKVLVATTGRVRVKVDASRGPIQIGDLLVTSDVAGVAMKSEPVEFAGRKMHMPGTIIGKALEPLAKGSGEILVLLSLQ